MIAERSAVPRIGQLAPFGDATVVNDIIKRRTLALAPVSTVPRQFSSFPCRIHLMRHPHLARVMMRRRPQTKTAAHEGQGARLFPVRHRVVMQQAISLNHNVVNKSLARSSLCGGPANVACADAVAIA